MASAVHEIQCPKCGGTKFREEHIVELDSSVVIRDDLPLPARTVREQYRYICIQCNEILNLPWTGHHE
ncbi:DNA-directed RNA polymerase subunit RPC12/RpoP [Alicyclobacillus cycloheptanicus]|uniref:DNA-directed RNA polymerase subunit RPC12/RpoP n=1 Tax=Alicyclobacillus cycloheptanicus TaxID=1457 RepID=A0ABT9XEQ0_9BACL|nr:DNA-directed RNA polymerase subunit RPC12/RpoP [Alicyclobacillus cycloheptanicus]